MTRNELSELPECVLCECPVRRAERGVRSGARVPSLTRVAGHAQRSGQNGARERFITEQATLPIGGTP